MEIINSVRQMSQRAEDWRQQGQKIAFVPTMGYFHEGHLSLMRQARRLGDVLVVSLFVNPIQFGPQEDLNDYPRDLKRDARLAEEQEVDVLFVPDATEMYPEGFQTYVEVTKLTNHLCGLSRPGHFRGVTTVVAKLFNIVKPHVAVFGLKDYQQYLVIKRMVADLNFDIEIVGHPIVREPDGLAMSSRNKYLQPEERPSALSLYKSLKMAQEMVNAGVRDCHQIIEKITQFIASHPYITIDYVRICDPETLEDINEITDKALMALAVKVGRARLIDNAILEVKNEVYVKV